MRVVLERCYNDLRLLYVPNKTLKAEGFFRSNKVPTFSFSSEIYMDTVKFDFDLFCVFVFSSGFCREL